MRGPQHSPARIQSIAQAGDVVNGVLDYPG